jgi:hypothetical protein
MICRRGVWRRTGRHRRKWNENGIIFRTIENTCITRQWQRAAVPSAAGPWNPCVRNYKVGSSVAANFGVPLAWPTYWRWKSRAEISTGTPFGLKIRYGARLRPDATLAGQKALVAHSTLDDVYWVRVRPNKVLVIRLHGGNASLLNSVRAKLSSLKIKVSDKAESVFGKLANDAAQLGMSSDEVHKLCGRPLESFGAAEFFISAKYLIEIQFQGSQFQTNDSALYISYTPLHDSEKFLEHPSHEALSAQIQPFDETGLTETLKQQTNGGKLKWTSIMKNRWKRTDGAMAVLTSHALVITTAANWPNVHLPE